MSDSPVENMLDNATKHDEIDASSIDIVQPNPAFDNDLADDE